MAGPHPFQRSRKTCKPLRPTFKTIVVNSSLRLYYNRNNLQNPEQPIETALDHRKGGSDDDEGLDVEGQLVADFGLARHAVLDVDEDLGSGFGSESGVYTHK